jgi:hypothetical protein
VKVSGGFATSRDVNPQLLELDTDQLRKIRRRVEDALRKSGDGQILRIAELLGVKISE